MCENANIPVSGLDAIGVRVEGPDLQALARETARPLLHEIRHALERLLKTGEETVIDLRSLPLGELGERYLLEELGTGELDCRLEALGASTVRESAYPGVWVVTHENAAGVMVGRFLEVTFLPSILKSDPIDVRSGLDRLTERLEADPGDAAKENAVAP
jgi:hydrogenase-1 operon protein HyaF